MSMERNQIFNKDCVQGLRGLPAGSVDLVFADPPFNIGYEYDTYDDSREANEYLKWCREWMEGAYNALKPDGTFWLAIGDEFAAELKIEAQKLGFHCRSWVIWYYTFGVNCVNGFSRSHTHLFHFVKDKSKFTFNRMNPQIRVKSARQLVYADKRANPIGRLPDNTWIIRPQDAPQSFSPNHDTWYFARVAGTFKEREGFHGCQMPEQLLARIIRSSSSPQDVVVDPFSGSGTTLAVAKKLGRQWIGFELSSEYAKYATERVERCNVGEAIDGPSDPIESAPATRSGKKLTKKADESGEAAVVEAYGIAGEGYPADYLLCDPELNSAFIAKCQELGGKGSPFYWNNLLLRVRKSGKLPHSQRQPERIDPAEMDSFGFASEVAWRLLSIDYRKTLDEILCAPEFAAEFDRLAKMFGPVGQPATPLQYRRIALSLRKRSKNARRDASEFASWFKGRLEPVNIDDVSHGDFEIPGVFLLRAGTLGVYAGETENVRARIESIRENDNWRGLGADSVCVMKLDAGLPQKYALKSAMVQRESPLLNCRLFADDSEIPA
ncbi:MAG: site-specific DNA-methyltransferase [Planctomycetaceae bacterium]